VKALALLVELLEAAVELLLLLCVDPTLMGIAPYCWWLTESG
jgi:hypothetical protein